MFSRIRMAALLAAAPLMVAGFAACGNDDDNNDEPLQPQTYEVVGVDYAFQDLPDRVAAGSTINFRNGSDVEAHELVAIRIPDDEDRPASELIQLSDEEIDAIFGQTMPAMVLIAAPGEEGFAVVGDGTVTEPGRYIVVCFFPVGGDPDEILDPEAEGPPDTGDAPPHAAEGMYGELTVE